MRRYFIAGNWKMNKTVAEALELVEGLKKEVSGVAHRVMVAPPFTALDAVAKSLKGSEIILGAQNMSDQESGAHTGEVSVLMLKDLGVEVVILGHSERRLIYGESDEFINRKVRLAISQGLEVILCVGETLEQREAGKAEAVVEGQLAGSLKDVSEADLKKVTIAYEPVWAIGTGKTATPGDADAIHKAVRKKISGLYSAQAAEDLVIQYGGSVKPDNAKELMGMENIDGALVGGAALKLDSFVPIVKFDT
ncbi:triose-phosphate isomerase [Marispirochaeta aestuarii]|uniref:triose-phosphate isomerase n=1 Tax=Marispirochaeta aestuarii TaxID=1963862 RepID=UPI0029C7207D|nr:triose-phosphate isomerase [Marispirochaeta aestuarii]